MDDYDAITTTSSGTASSADTKNPIYIGGKPGEYNYFEMHQLMGQKSGSI